MFRLLPIFSTNPISAFLSEALLEQKLSPYTLAAIVLLASLSMAVKRTFSWLLYWVPRSRPSPRQFRWTLAQFFIHQLLTYITWVMLLWWVGGYLSGAWLPLMHVAGAVALMYVPHIFAFFGLVPFFGKFISGLVALCSAVVFIYTAQNVLGMTLFQTMAAGALGAAVAQFQRWVLALPLYPERLEYVLGAKSRPTRELPDQFDNDNIPRSQSHRTQNGDVRTLLSPKIETDSHRVSPASPASLIKQRSQSGQREQQPHG